MVVGRRLTKEHVTSVHSEGLRVKVRPTKISSGRDRGIRCLTFDLRNRTILVAVKSPRRVARDVKTAGEGVTPSLVKVRGYLRDIPRETESEERHG